MLVIPFSLTVSASSAEPIGWILEALQAIDYINNLNEDVRNMTGDEYYDFITEQDSFDSAAWLALISTLGQPAAFEIMENADNMHAAKYNAVKVQEDSIRNIYNQATKINTANLRYFSFDDLGLSTYQDISCSITYTGYSCLPDVGTAWNKNNLDGKFTLNTGSFGSAVRLYNGSSMAFPVIYVPANTSFYQNGVLLPNINATWWVPLGSDTLIQILGSSFIQPYTISGDTLNDLTFGFYNSGRKENLSIYKNGVEVGQINTDSYPGWEVADLLSKMVGYCITTDGDSNAGVIAPPADIPYDDDGYVYICIPEDKSDVVYLSPTTYNEYINNGTIIEGDYVSNVTDETVNNITNNITNIYEGSSYDDTNLLNKLEGWFSELYKKIDKLADSLEPSNVINNVYNTYINPPPVYETFSDCFYDNVPAAAEAKQLFNDLCSVTETDLDIDTDVPSDGTVTDETLDLSYKIAFYNPFSETKKTDEYEIINFDWYAPYREDIRNLLKISAYVMGFCAILSAIKSVFGVHGGGD